MPRALTIVDPGPLSSVQDGGRPGWAHLGVPRSGAVDLPALELGNRLVGNHRGSAGIETTSGGISLRVAADLTVAVTGASAEVTVDGRPGAWGEPVVVHAGETLAVGAARSGLRSYVALAGGVACPPVLGSRSTDTLSGTGPAPLSGGDVLPVAPAQGLPTGADVVVPHPVQPPVTLRVSPGPRTDWFTDETLATLTGTSYAVSADADRVGIRLDGPVLQRRPEHQHRELPSEGIVLGAVQVPASGHPLVFLNDHPTTGGYPVVAVVDPRDLPICAQLRPGDTVRMRMQEA